MFFFKYHKILFCRFSHPITSLACRQMLRIPWLFSVIPPVNKF